MAFALEAIRCGWRGFARNARSLVLASYALLVTFAGIGLASSVISATLVSEPGAPLVMNDRTYAAGLAVSVILESLGYVVVVAFAGAATDVVNGQAFAVLPALRRTSTSDAVVTGLIWGTLYTAGFLYNVLAGMVVLILGYFAPFFVATGSNPLQAIAGSAWLVAANPAKSLALMLCSIAVLMVGGLIFFVGLLVAFPVVLLAAGYAFPRLRSGPAAE